MDKACYRKLKKYKYQLMKPFVCDVGIKHCNVDNASLKLSNSGLLEIKKGYAWDGPSGPTIDTQTFMRGALVHDALYQLIRMEIIPYSQKNHADKLLQKICLDDGMFRFRAWYVYHAVRLFGASSAKPGSENPVKIICVPKT